MNLSECNSKIRRPLRIDSMLLGERDLDLPPCFPQSSLFPQSERSITLASRLERPRMKSHRKRGS
jgi:hypothetical protein